MNKTSFAQIYTSIKIGIYNMQYLSIGRSIGREKFNDQKGH